MKKIYTIIMAVFAIVLSAFAQDAQEPNRLLLNNTIGNYTGYILDRVDNLTFARVDGVAKAEIEISDADIDEITLSITKSDVCTAYKLDVIPATVADAYNDLTLITYIDRNPNVPVFYDDYTDASLTGITLNPGSEYVVVTIGLDPYGIEDGVERARFTTESLPVAGDPQVTAEVVDRQLQSFSVKFTPNNDVMEYYCVAGEKGTMQSQYEMFGPMFGFSNFTEMIMAWGAARISEDIVTWSDMAPNTEYEVFYVALDVAGNPAPYQVIETSTLALGGEGAAWVDIELGDYIYAEWGDETLPSQFLTFTPNDESSCYRFGVYLAETYDTYADDIKNELRSDPPMPAAYWFFYDPITTDFQINPNTDCVAIAAAKNGNGEWGEINEFRFTTAESPSPEANAPAKTAKTPKNGKFKARNVKNMMGIPFNHVSGKLPTISAPSKIQIR